MTVHSPARWSVHAAKEIVTTARRDYESDYPTTPSGTVFSCRGDQNGFFAGIDPADAMIRSRGNPAPGRR